MWRISIQQSAVSIQPKKMKALPLIFADKRGSKSNPNNQNT
jgi:hypothetical protein